jgi:hypothetical protein
MQDLATLLKLHIVTQYYKRYNYIHTILQERRKTNSKKVFLYDKLTNTLFSILKKNSLRINFEVYDCGGLCMTYITFKISNKEMIFVSYTFCNIE